jgi:hypothetical protein
MNARTFVVILKTEFPTSSSPNYSFKKISAEETLTVFVLLMVRVITRR